MQGTLVDGGRTELTALTIDVAEDETTEETIQRLAKENPVTIFSRKSCCMCHVMKRLLLTLGVHPTVIELDDSEMARARSALPAHDSDDDAPVVFIGGAHVGGLESLMGLHLSGRLLPRLKEAGAVWL